MCGIAGFWSPTLSAAERRETVRGMTHRLAHRGPDADGHWVPADTPIALGHRRLSILDLSAAGAQPMWSANGRYVVSFNGEIYNFRQLRDRLSVARRDLPRLLGHRGAARGVRGVGHRRDAARGDGNVRARRLGRARSGAHPRARSHRGEAAVLRRLRRLAACSRSELKALRAHPHWIGETDPGAVCTARALRLRARAATRSTSGIGKVTPGTRAVLPAARRARPLGHSLLVGDHASRARAWRVRRTSRTPS